MAAAQASAAGAVASKGRNGSRAEEIDAARATVRQAEAAAPMAVTPTGIAASGLMNKVACRTSSVEASRSPATMQGHRIALGATVRAVVSNIPAEGARIVAFGSLAGVAGSLIAARLIQRQLYGVSQFDLTSFALALILLSSAALAACLIPALRAARVDPVRALNVQ